MKLFLKPPKSLTHVGIRNYCLLRMTSGQRRDCILGALRNIARTDALIRKVAFNVVAMVNAPGVLPEVDSPWKLLFALYIHACMKISRIPRCVAVFYF